MSKQVLFQYRDGANFKDDYLFEVSDGFNRKVEEEVVMGEFDTPTEEQFFEGVHEHSYDEEFDHNLLTVLEIGEAGSFPDYEVSWPKISE